MLPGFRFLFAAILLSTSILVFGVGAVALLRAAHEEFADIPSWRTGPQEQVFARSTETREAVLATLRVEPQTTKANSPEAAPSPTNPEAAASPASEPEQPSLKPEAAGQPATDQVQTAVVGPPQQPAESAPQAEPPAPVQQATVAPAAADAPSPTDVTASTGVPTGETTLTASDAAASPPTESSSTADSAAPTAVAVNDPTVVVETEAPAKAEDATPKASGDAQDKNLTKKRTHRAKKRHRVVQRPPAPQVAATVQPFNPFAPNPFVQPQPAPAPATRTR